MIVIGSYALQQYGLLERSPSDIDLVITGDAYRRLFTHLSNNGLVNFSRPINKRRFRLALNNTSTQYDVSLDVLESEKILLDESEHWDSIKHDTFGDFPEKIKIPPLSWLYAIKSSHIYCDVRGFSKNIVDLHAMRNELANRGEFKFTEEQLRFIDIRRKEAEEYHRHRTPSLKVTNDEFFEVSSQTVGYDFVHDDLHEAMKHVDTPIYQKMKPDQGSAFCSREMFAALPLQYKIFCVMEEAYVIATERYLLKIDISPKDAFIRALNRICTTLCGGFFREFAVIHYFEVLVEFDPKYATKVITAYNDNRLGLLKSPEEVKQSMRILRGNATQH